LPFDLQLKGDAVPQFELTTRLFRYVTTTSLILLMCTVLSGCALFQSDPEELTLRSDYDRAFEEVRNVISNRFEIKTANREKGRIKTAWRMRPREMGTQRKRIISRVKVSEEHPDQIRITLRTEVEQVSDILRPYKTEDAEWESADRDRELEKDFIKLIRFRLKSKEMEKDILEEIEEGAEQDRRLEELQRGQEDPESPDE
jgi:hypothetical protein